MSTDVLVHGNLAEKINSMKARLGDMKSPNAKYSFGDSEYEELAKNLPGSVPLPRPSMQEQRVFGEKFVQSRLKLDPGPRE